MRLFICNRSIDLEESDKIVDEFLLLSGNAMSILRETAQSADWKTSVEKKLKQVDFTVFLLGVNTFDSEQIKWEYDKAKDLNQNIVGIKLSPEASKSIIFYQGFYVFNSVEQCYSHLEKIYEEQKKLKLEQYKMMVSSTEKVTDQRLKVNNLFFTVTSSILSVAFLIGKTFNFSPTSIVGLFVLTSLAFLVTFFWEKLINSYGKLNTGKFKVIDKIEKDLRTNMFEDEWRILTGEVKYKPNSETERTIIRRFRTFILLLAVGELIYILNN